MGLSHRNVDINLTNLLFGSVFQTFTVVSEEAETVFEPSSVTATAFTAAVWPFITCIHSALDTHQYLQYVEQFNYTHVSVAN